MEIDIIQLWASMNGLVRGVVIVLTVQALTSVYVVVDRLILLILSRWRSRRFATDASALISNGDYDAALAETLEHRRSHLANFIETGIRTYLDHKRRGHSQSKAAKLAMRALERKGDQLSEALNRGLGALASTGSTAPFVGLLGTVLGILNAFKLIGEEASGGMGTIGPAIAEALIVTGYGLLVAIPSVLAFNWLSGQIATYEAGLANAGSELVDQLEGGLPAARTTSEGRIDCPSRALQGALAEQ